jgi:hypothetical protein
VWESPKRAGVQLHVCPAQPAQRFAEVRDEDALWGDLRPELLEAVKTILEATMEDELTAQVMAERYERTEIRCDHRNGIYRRMLVTELGAITDLAVRRRRLVPYRPGFLARAARRTATVDDVVPPPATGQLHAGDRSIYGYRPSTSMPPFWHPYEIHEIGGRRRFVQARLQNLDTRPPQLMPPPTSPLLVDPNAPAAGPVHQIEPATVPVTGLRLDRRFVLGRSTDGQPVLWLPRRRLPLVGPPVSNLRFDVLEQQLEPS